MSEACRLFDEARLPAAEDAEIRAEVDWLCGKVPVPQLLRLHYRSGKRPLVVFWLKSEAVEHVQHMRRLTGLIASSGVVARMLRTSKPGKIVYEDEYQVGAIPFRDTFSRGGEG